jgi:hypothetical protein
MVELDRLIRNTHLYRQIVLLMCVFTKGVYYDLFKFGNKRVRMNFPSHRTHSSVCEGRTSGTGKGD